MLSYSLSVAQTFKVSSQLFLKADDFNSYACFFTNIIVFCNIFKVGFITFLINK